MWAYVDRNTSGSVFFVIVQWCRFTADWHCRQYLCICSEWISGPIRDAKSIWMTYNYLKLGIFHFSPFFIYLFLLFLCLVFLPFIFPSRLYLPMLRLSTYFASTPRSALDSWYVGWRTRFLCCLTSTKDNRIIDSATFQRTRNLGCRHQLLPTWCNPEENTQHIGLTSVGTRKAMYIST